MTEKPGSGSGRMKHGGTKQTSTMPSRRDFIKLGLAVTGIVGVTEIVGPTVVNYIDSLALDKKLYDFRKTLPIVDNNYFSPPDKEQLFLAEGWGQKFPIAIIPPNSTPVEIATLSQNAGKKALDELNAKMKISAFRPFQETIEYVNFYFRKDIPGKLNLSVDFFLGSTTGADSVMATKMFLDSEDVLEETISANAWLFSPTAQPEKDNVLTKMVWALGLCHEKNHHLLGLQMFNFLKKSDLDPKKSMAIINNDKYQEPYAYWNQGAATFPLLNLGFSSNLPELFIRNTQKWKELSDKGISWYDDEWVNFINEDLSPKSTTNIPFNQVVMKHDGQMLSAKEPDLFKA